MGITDELKQWIQENNLQYVDRGFGVIRIADQDYLERQVGEFEQPIHSKGGLLQLNINKQIIQYIFQGKIDNIIYKFGGQFYYTPISHIANVKLIPFKYVGSYDDSHVPDFGRSYLGVHGRYEMMNGTRDYNDWCKKAKFLKYDSLGICEKHTLAGTLPFQLQCNKNNIKSIIGYSVDVLIKHKPIEVKLYTINDAGWRNLLHINKLINVDDNDDQQISLKQLKQYSQGLVCCVLPSFQVNYQLLTALDKAFDKTYYQITTNQYYSDKQDKNLLNNIKKYLDNRWYTQVPPVLISDAYCLDKHDTHIKTTLNKQGQVKFNFQTSNHYFKSIDEMFNELELLFDQTDERLEDIFIEGLRSLDHINDICKFQIQISQLFLPSYQFDDPKLNENKQDTFLNLIAEGLEDKYSEQLYGPHGQQFQLELEERVLKEFEIIKKGGFVDYFLILWDIVNWCKSKKIQVGPGRGSAAGSVISYALGIVKIDPLQFDLIFERFLNESRIKSELPDIDLDFASDRRDEVVEYMKQKYGHDYVCRVGTYGTMQMRGVIKELARAYGIKGEKYNMNFVTKLISQDNEKWEPLFQDALSQPLLKRFIRDNSEIINDSKLALNAIKSASMHACATIIVPKIKNEQGKDLNIYQQIPLRKDQDGSLISEWEGEILAAAGYLKEDILSTRQMAKIGKMIELIEQNHAKQIDPEKISLNDNNVFDLFKKGLNQDVFHFGSSGLTNYLKQVKPKNIEELIASIALYRPGAMASNAHNDYIKLKKGELDPQYDYMLESVTKDTYGLYIYQEQIMKAAQILGGFSLSEADGVRKAMGKKIQHKMDSYKIQFVENAVSKGCSREEANSIWTKMEVFAGYGFNKSHAAAYSVIGYHCNWFKYYYPLEFWTVAFEYAKESKLQDFISEVEALGHIKIVPSNINVSGIHFYSDKNTNKIYWNLSAIKYVGSVAADAIIQERNDNGKFFSIEEFVERLSGRAVNKQTIQHLILAGCFDEMYKINNPSGRFYVMKKYFDTRKEDLPKQYDDNKQVDHFWSILQGEVSQLTKINYYKMFDQTQFGQYKNQYISSEEFIEQRSSEITAMIAGVVDECVVRKTKKDKKEYAVIKLTQDQYQMSVRVWPQQFNPDEQYYDNRFDGLKEYVKSDSNNLCIFRGKLSYNDFTKSNELVLTNRIKGPIYSIIG